MMALNFLKCPSCNSNNFVKNGDTYDGKQDHICKDCDTEFVENPPNTLMSQQTLIDRLLLEKLQFDAIARVAEVSESWLQEYVNGKFENIEQEVDVKEIKIMS